ncbi:MAG: hypothetical protein WBG10_17375 [Pseudolabrys sp.]
MRAPILLIVLGALGSPACAHSLEVFGYIGELGEWEVTATVTENVSRRTKEFSGPVTMTHVGLCAQDGPEQKTGEIRLQISNSSSRLTATLSVAGLECTYSGRLSDFYTGMMICPDRAAVPLKLWVK